jgi:sugar lactone lactonase YvrE
MSIWPKLRPLPRLNRPAELALAIEATLGEGAIWDAAAQRLLWVDITERRLMRFDPVSLTNEVFQLNSRIGTVVNTARGDLLIALQEGVARFDPRTGLVSDLRCPVGHDATRIRFNDGKCDPRGRFWAGTMALDFTPQAGALYCFEADGTIHQRASQVSISNGLVWSPDLRFMYYIDSGSLNIDLFEYSVETGTIKGRRPTVRLPKGLGTPDGMTLDAEGMIWVAFWGGSSALRIDPQTAFIIERINVPAPHVTSCAFGGPGLKSLYITTAREGLSPEQLAAFPLSGSLFVAHLEVGGVPAFVYAG